MIFKNPACSISFLAVVMVNLISLQGYSQTKEPFFLGNNKSQSVKQFRISDVDGDGDFDVVYQTKVAIGWIENNGDEEFSEPEILFQSENPVNDIEVGDIDNDGDSDIVFVNLTLGRRNQLSYLPNFGNAEFGEQIFILDNEDRSVISDVVLQADSSGSNSLLLAQYLETTLLVKVDILADSILFKTVYTGEISTSHLIPGQMLVADLNSDGISDLIMRSEDYVNHMYLNVYLGTESGTYERTELDFLPDNGIRGAIISDIDNDEDKDLLVATSKRTEMGADTTDMIYLYKNDGEGIFSEREIIGSFSDLFKNRASEPIYSYNKLTTLDFNNDGWSDIFVTGDDNPYRSSKIRMLQNNRDGTFSAAVTLNRLGRDFNNLLAFDVNNDGDDDLLASGSQQSGINLFLSDSAAAGFSEQIRLVNPVVSSPLDLISFKVFGSQKDLIVATANPSRAIIYFRNNGDYTFKEPIVLDTTFSYRTVLARADVNRDGSQDLIALTQQYVDDGSVYPGFHYQIRWFPNDMDGSFGAPQLITEGISDRHPVYFELGDVNGDGGDDLVILSVPIGIGQPYLNVLVNNTGSFSSPQEIIFLPEFTSFSLLDIDNDETKELVLLTPEMLIVGPREFEYQVSFYAFNLDSLPNSEVIEKEDTSESISVSFGEHRVNSINYDFGDLNGDGLTDFAFSTHVGPQSFLEINRTITAVLRNGAGESPIIITIDTLKTGNFGELRLTDIDADGDLDIIAQTVEAFSLDLGNKYGLIWYQNDGSGHFIKQEFIAEGRIQNGSFIMTDLNRDGSEELLSINYLEGDIAIYKGSDVAALTDLEFNNNEVPNSVILYPNYPNPFNPETTIQYSVPASGLVELKVFNMLGQEVQTLVSTHQNAGIHTVRFNASQLSSGLYMYRLKSGNSYLTRKMLLIK